MNPAEQRRAPGTGQYYADYAPITNQGGRSGPNRPPDIPQVPAAMQEYPDYPGNKNNEETTVKKAIIMHVTTLKKLHVTT